MSAAELMYGRVRLCFQIHLKVEEGLRETSMILNKKKVQIYRV